MLLAPVTQGKFRNGFDIFLADDRRTPPGRMGTGAAQPDQVGAQAIDARSKTTFGDLRQRLVIQRNAIQ